MTQMQRTVSWGDALTIAVFKSPGGLSHIVEVISEVMGPHYGTRNTFAKLLKAESPEELTGKDQWRAWLMLTALAEDVEEWGIPADLAPKYIDVNALKQELWAAMRLSDSPHGAPVTNRYPLSDYGIAA